MEEKFIVKIRMEMPDGQVADGYVSSPNRTGLYLTENIDGAYPFPGRESAQEYIDFVHKNKPPKVTQTQWRMTLDQ